MTAKELIQSLSGLQIWTEQELQEINTSIDGGEVPEEIKAKINAGLSKLATRDYLLQDPNYLQEQQQARSQQAAEIHNSYKGYGFSKFNEIFGGENGLFQEDDLKNVFLDKDTRSKQALEKGLKLVKDTYEMKLRTELEKAAKESGDVKAQEFQKVIGQKDEAIQARDQRIETITNEYETKLSQVIRNNEVDNIKLQLNQMIDEFNLADSGQKGLAFMAVENALFPNFYLKLVDGKVKAFNKDSTDIPANHPTQKTTLDVKGYIGEILLSNKLLAANSGGGDPARKVRIKGENPPSGNDPEFTTEYKAKNGVNQNSLLGSRMSNFVKQQTEHFKTTE